MRSLWLASAVAFLVAGCLEVAFFALSCTGIGVGGVMTFGPAPTSPEEAFIGPLLLGLYLLFFGGSGIGAVLHLAAGIALVAGRRPRALLWAAVVGSIAPMVTVYCTLPAMIAAVLGLIALLTPEDEPLSAP